MKKILLASSVIFLLAAGCNASQSTGQPGEGSLTIPAKTTDPKTFTSVNYHISFQYPGTLIISNGAGTMEGVSVNKPGTVKSDLFTIAYVEKAAEAPKVTLGNQKTITIAEVKATQGELVNKVLSTTTIHISVPINGHMYIISYDKSSATNPEIASMIASLKFTK